MSDTITLADFFIPSVWYPHLTEMIGEAYGSKVEFDVCNKKLKGRRGRGHMTLDYHDINVVDEADPINKILEMVSADFVSGVKTRHEGLIIWRLRIRVMRFEITSAWGLRCEFHYDFDGFKTFG